MSLSCRQQRLLGRIDDAVCRSDPRLASMLGIFARLTAGEEMQGREQLPTPALSRFRAAVLMAAAMTATLITRAAAACARAIRSAAAASAALVSWVAGNRRPARPVAAPGSSAADTRAGGPRATRARPSHERRTSC